MRILIAGASRGLGKYLAENLVSDTAQIFGTYHNTDASLSTQAEFSRVDVTDEAQVKTWIDTVAGDGQQLSLINCVGVNYNSMLHKSETENWMRVIDTNLKASYLLMKHIIPHMRNSKFGRIVCLASVVPQIGVSGTSAYSASKSALWGLTRSTALENAKYGITVNTINLGYFDIGMILEVPSEILSGIIDRIPMARLGDPSNVLNAVQFLLSSDYITGSQINLNGGLY